MIPAEQAKPAPIWKLKPRTRAQGLKRIKKLIQNGFIQGGLARNKNGNTRNPADLDAVRFCLEGAAQRAKCGIAYVDGEGGAQAFLGVDWRFNDAYDTTQETVISFLDCEIAKETASV